MNVREDGGTTGASLAHIGARWAIVVARRDEDVGGTLADYLAHDIYPLLLLDRLSIEAFGPVDSAHIAASTGRAITVYATRYDRYAVAWIVGNEPDHVSPSSWSMSKADFQTMGKAARAGLPGKTIICGGLVSGQPSWLDGQDLSWMSVVGVHPYGKRPEPNWPSPTWGTGYIGDLIDGYAAYGKPIMVTEIGLSTQEVDEAFQGQYVERMCNAMARRTDIIAVQWFCMTDDMVDGFGLYRNDGSPKPSADAYAFASTLAIPVPLPTPDGGGEIPEPPKVPETPEAAELEMWRQAWTAIAPTLEYNATIHTWAIPTYWREHYAEIGSPLGHEIPEGGGPTRQAFASAMLRWNGTAVERLA
jgi:hypothetical protein